MKLIRMDQSKREFKCRAMTMEDIARVHEIESKSFTTPWAKESFEKELSGNKLACYMVIEHAGQVIGYGGYWMIVDEAHITNIAIDPDMREMGFGKQLVIHMIKEIREKGIDHVTLEVRESNVAALELYTGLGFHNYGRRRDYYQKPVEDAIIMWLTL